ACRMSDRGEGWMTGTFNREGSPPSPKIPLSPFLCPLRRGDTGAMANALNHGSLPPELGELDPPPRLLLGPGPINCDPRVLRAMALPMLGQFDPVFTRYMNDVMALLRRLLVTENRWSLLVDGTARAGIEAILVSLIAPGDPVLVPIFGRFGHLLAEIAQRCGAEVHALETAWGTVFRPEQIEEALKRVRPALLAMVHGDTSTT